MHKKFLLAVSIVFVGAILLRMLLIHWTLQYGNNGDFTRYEDWARIAHIYNFADTYTTSHLSIWKSFPNNQPPGSLYILSGFYELWILSGKVITHITHTKAGGLLWVNTYLQHFIMKLPAFISDILTGIVIFLLVAKEGGKKKGLFAAALVLFNPVIFYNSAIWGQMDSINNLFFLLSLFFAFRKNTIFSILFYAMSLYIKLSLLPLIPFYLVFLYFVSGKHIKKIVIGISLSVFFWILATFPVSIHPLLWLIKELPIIARGEIQSMTVAAFNFWFALTCFPTRCAIPDITNTFMGISFATWGYGIFFAFTLPLFILQIKKNKKFIQPKNIFLLLSIVALLIFLFLPNMHDRYMYPVFSLLAISIALSKRWKIIFVVFAFLTLFNLDNIVYSWYPIVFNSTTTFYHIFYGPWLRWLLSIATVIVGIWFYLITMKTFLTSVSKE